MNDIKQLEERISQLTELVASTSDTIKKAKEMIKAAEQERDRLCDLVNEGKPKFERVGFEETYYYIRAVNNGTFRIENSIDIGCEHSTSEFKNNNYFHTKERAQEVIDKINFLLKLERLHDTFCPDYMPDWSGYKYNFYVFYNNHDKCYGINTAKSAEDKSNVYFPSMEIAQKVCDILNKELAEKSNKS